jgi:hypothetical protein
VAIAEAYAGSATIGTTEYSCPNAGNYNSANGITTDGVYQVFLDLANMTITEQYQIRIYEKCRSSDTQRVIYEAIVTGIMADTWVSPSLILLHGWDVTLKKLAGTDRALHWSIRQVA